MIGTILESFLLLIPSIQLWSPESGGSMVSKLRFRLRGNNVRRKDDSWEEIPGIAGSGDSQSNDEEEDWKNLFDVNQKRISKKDLKVDHQSFTLIFLLVLIGLALLFAKYMDRRLPKALSISDLQNNSMLFIEERARTDLTDLTRVGPRVSGSYMTDVRTVQDILDRLQKINESLVPESELNFEFETQNPSGAFYMDDDEGCTSVYREVSNVVAKLEPKEPSLRSNKSVLFNCHYDSKPNAPGATDNMISCVTLLEILRIFCAHPLPLNFKNSLVFLFNGAEELGMHAAHGFVKGNNGRGHRWAENLVSFVNLEGAGSGGREILFQTGPKNGWILKAYQSTPYPYGLVVGEEAFQLGLMASDTDFRIFRDFRNIPGFDMAFIKNGWLYHTTFDTVNEIPPGSIQHVGENALALAKYFSTLDYNEVDMGSGEKMVFFDVFGLFMVVYSETVGIIVNIIIAVIFIFITIFQVKVKRSSIKICLLLLASTVVSWALGIAVSVFCGAFFNWTGYYMPFYSYPTLSLLIFGLPALLTSTLSFSFFWGSSQRKTWIASKFTTAILVLALTFVTRVVYVFTMVLVFAILSWSLGRFLFFRFKQPKMEMVASVLIGELIPLLFALYMVITLIDIFVPILGRMGNTTDPNIYLGLILGALVPILPFNGLQSYLVKCAKIKLAICLIFCIFILSPLIVVGFVGDVPYQQKTPMRIRLLNVDRTWYNPTDGLTPSNATVNRTDSGYWFWPFDPHTIDYLPEIAKTVRELKDQSELEANSNSCADLYCNQLFIWPTTTTIKNTPWVATPVGLPAAVKDFVHMTVLKNAPVEANPRQRHLLVTFNGPSQLTVVVSPGKNYELIDWDFAGEIIGVPKPGKVEFEGRLTYFVFMTNGYGVNSTDVSMTFELKGSQQVIGKDTLVNVMYVGHYMHDEQVQQESFRKLVDDFPSWTNVMPITSVLKQYTILNGLT